MRVLVTGNLGYIGPVVVRRLRSVGHYTVGLDTGWYVDRYAESPVWPDKQLFTDIREPFNWHLVDAVVHLAGLSNDPMGALDEKLTREINVEGTLGLIRQTPGARHVIISSCSVYGATTELAREDTLTAPLTAYARGKAEVDARAPELTDDYVSLRLGTVFGYSPGHRLDLVVNRMTFDAVNDGTVTATGNAQRPLVHVEDVADAIAFMLGRTETGRYNVVSENWRMQDLARTVAKATGATAVFKPGGADARDYAADGTKLWTLGWSAKRTVEGSLKELAEWTYSLPGGCDEGGAPVPAEYERLSALKKLIATGRLDSSLRPIYEVAA